MPLVTSQSLSVWHSVTPMATHEPAEVAFEHISPTPQSAFALHGYPVPVAMTIGTWHANTARLQKRPIGQSALRTHIAGGVVPIGVQRLDEQ